MCLIFFVSYQHCDHNSILGIFNCGLNCPTGTRHTFYIEDPSGPCQTCTFLRNEELDPDIVPVRFYAPTHEPSGGRFHHVHSENIGRKGFKHRTTKQPGNEATMAPDYEPTTGSLSDPDSLTSEWRLGPSSPTQSHFHIPGYPYAYPRPHTQIPVPNTAQHPQRRGQDSAPDMRRRAAAHRYLVQDQLKKLPTRLAAQQQ